MPLFTSRDTTLAQLNLRDFFANYTVNSNVVKRRTHPVIIRTFPAYSSNPKGDKYGQYDSNISIIPVIIY